MNDDANLGDRQLLDEDDLNINRVPTVSDDVFVEKTYAADDDLDDDSGIGDESTTGVRSLGDSDDAEHRRTDSP